MSEALERFRKANLEAEVAILAEHLRAGGTFPPDRANLVANAVVAAGWLPQPITEERLALAFAMFTTNGLCGLTECEDCDCFDPSRRRPREFAAYALRGMDG